MVSNEEHIKEEYINFDEYIRQGEPTRKEAALAWSTAIGLQAVDGLKTSEYLQETARQHIEGNITIDEARQLIKAYYESKTVREKDDDDMEEADRVSANIVKVLSQPTFAFNANGYISVHRRIFEGVFKHAGQLRTYDITKREWVLRGDTVNYLNWEDLRRAIDYDIQQEKEFSYRGLSADDIVSHIAKFVSGLWQIHAFREGNTRATAVFTIQYLRSIGFSVDNDLFAKHSWYFRNALVRANYKNVQLGIDYTPTYLERFFRNLLLGEHWDLRNRYLHIQASGEWKVQPRLDKPGISTEQVPNKLAYPAEQVPNKLTIDNPSVRKIVMVIGSQELKVSEIMEGLGLKHRPTFIENYLSPAIEGGFVRLLYRDKPRHPRQKYLLTIKGFTLFNSIQGKSKESNT